MTAIGEYDISLDLNTDDGLFIRFHGTAIPRCAVLAFDVERRLVVFKEPGRHYYGGQGAPWLYAPAEFRLMELKAWPDSDDRQVTAREVFSWPVR